MYQAGYLPNVELEDIQVYAQMDHNQCQGKLPNCLDNDPQNSQSI
jgi:hypothetical protein